MRYFHTVTVSYRVGAILFCKLSVYTVRVRETRWTCPANFENVRRRGLISPDKMSSEKFDIHKTFHSKMSGENSKCPAKDCRRGSNEFCVLSIHWYTFSTKTSCEFSIKSAVCRSSTFLFEKQSPLTFKRYITYLYLINI